MTCKHERTTMTVGSTTYHIVTHLDDETESISILDADGYLICTASDKGFVFVPYGTDIQRDLLPDPFWGEDELRPQPEPVHVQGKQGLARHFREMGDALRTAAELFSPRWAP